jgi:hypothetical protein
MVRALASVVAALVLVLALASSALATRPNRVYAAIDSPFTLSDVCAFDVIFEIDANKEYTMTFSDGRVINTGKLFVTVTNADTRKSRSYNISGPLHDGVVSGQSLLFSFTTEPAGGHLLLTHGPVVQVFGENGLESYSVAGSSVDVCAALS